MSRAVPLVSALLVALPAFAAPFVAGPAAAPKTGDPVVVVAAPARDAGEIVFDQGGVALSTFATRFIAVGVFPFENPTAVLAKSDALLSISGVRSAEWVCQ